MASRASRRSARATCKPSPRRKPLPYASGASTIAASGGSVSDSEQGRFIQGCSSAVQLPLPTPLPP